MDSSNALIPVSTLLGLAPGPDSDTRKMIIEKINFLILHDFEKLVYFLYWMDVSETKIDLLLRKFPQTDAAEMIADLMIEREAEKMKTREKFRREEGSEWLESEW